MNIHSARLLIDPSVTNILPSHLTYLIIYYNDYLFIVDVGDSTYMRVYMVSNGNYRRTS